MKKFGEFKGVDDFIHQYKDYESRFVSEGAAFAKGWLDIVNSFLKTNLPKAKIHSKTVIATIPHGTSFADIEKFLESILANYKIDEVVYDAVRSTFTFYGGPR